MTVMRDEFVPDLVLDDDHFLVFTRWAPDDLPANHVWLGIPEGEPLPVVEKWGAIIRHYRPDGTLCEGCITFDGEWQQKVYHLSVKAACRQGRPAPHNPYWTVESWEPLTISPSVLCLAPVHDSEGREVGKCNDHGFIRQGKWVKA